MLSRFEVLQAQQQASWRAQVDAFQRSVRLFADSQLRQAQRAGKSRPRRILGQRHREAGALRPQILELPTLTDVRSPRTNGSLKHRVSGVTRRQCEIAVLVARGYTNVQIAEALVVVPGTVANHLDHLRNRLGLQNRAQVAVWAVQQGLVSELDAEYERREA